MIKESAIDNVIGQLETASSDLSKSLFFETHEQFLHYLDEEHLKLLNEYEKDMAIFICHVIFQSFYHQHKMDLEIDIELFQEYEEKNWAIRDLHTNLNDSMDECFNNYPEEDLLAFVEDMVTDDEDQLISLPGKEIIFLTSKSYIDYLSKSTQEA